MNQLICNVQKYAWGKRGSESKVALYKKSQSPEEFEINENDPYAELWMGTHSNCPSKIKLLETSKNSKEETILLSEYLRRSGPDSLGSQVLAEFFQPTSSDSLRPGDLPFLFKVLSIRQALSIQAHPNKAHARELHARDPKNYPDANHKPEMLVAICDGFQALCGFRPAGEIARHFEQYPELADLCGSENTKLFIDTAKSDNSEELKLTLKRCFESLMKSDETRIGSNLDKLKQRILNEKEPSKVDTLFLRLLDEYPGDVGCFSIYLLNVIELNKGEAIFLAANIPHAYLFGEGVECMACSDNVVRAGLTPKFKDVQVLVSMLDYSMRSIDENKLRPAKSEQYFTEFRPNVNEFSVQQIHVNNQSSPDFKLTLPKLDTVSILIIIENSFHESHFLVADNMNKFDARSGLVYFIDRQADVVFHHGSSSNPANFLAFRAYADIK